MASDSPRKRLKEEATCFVCWDYYINPLFLDCGHSFCQACVSQCWKDLPDNATCPQCKTAVQRKNCHLNSQLANVVEIAKQLNSQLKEEVACGEVCEEHPKPSTAAFCKEDQVAFCWMCDGSQQHSDHNVVPMEVAAQEYKDCFSGYVEMLKKERAESVKVKCITLEGCEHLLKQTNAETQLIADVFRQLHGFLSKQENYLMLHVEPVAREITKKKIYDLGSLTQDIITLENTIRQLEEKCSQPANELLRDAEMILERCRKRSKFHKPEDFSYKLKWKRWELLDINALMRGLTQFFTDTLQNACFLQKAHVTLDADSSHPQLVLSPDAKSVRWTHAVKRLPNSYKRFEKHYCVVGCQEFQVGRYFWDVIVGNQEEWAVGVAKNSVKRKGFFSLGVKEGIFAMGRLAGQFKVLDAPHCPPLQVNRRLRKIRVSLNCSGGQVNFYDAQTATKLFGFTEIGSFQDTFLPFFWLNGRTLINLK